MTSALDIARATFIEGVRSEYGIMSDIGDECTGDVAVVYTAGPFTVMFLPTVEGEFFALDIHTFIDGEIAGRPTHITLRKEPQ